MVLYKIYKASFHTKRGTRRVYVGMTGNAMQRECALQQCGPHQPAWLRAGCLNFKYEILAENVQTKAAALATEALLAAHLWKSAPDQTRGGPWVLPTLSQTSVAELKAVSKCSALRDLLALPEAQGNGPLGVHLRGLSWTSTASSGSSATSASSASSSKKPLPIPSRKDQSAVVRKKRRLKKLLSGHEQRKQQGLRYGTAAFRAAKWGKKPTEARAKHWQTYKPMRPMRIIKKRPSRKTMSQDTLANLYVFLRLLSPEEATKNM